MPPRLNLVGQVFGRLTVKSFAGVENGNTTWACECVCANEVVIAGRSLKTGYTTSCGCFNKDASRERATTHGLSNHALYSVWEGMKYRCYNQRHKNYNNYGARGIYICDEWRDNPEIFIGWALNNGYAPGLTIDRIFVDGPYSPENCRWVTRAVQNQENRRGLRPVIMDNNDYFSTVANAARAVSGYASAIRGAAKGKLKTSAGHQWRYATQDDLDAIKELEDCYD